MRSNPERTLIYRALRCWKSVWSLRSRSAVLVKSRLGDWASVPRDLIAGSARITYDGAILHTRCRCALTILGPSPIFAAMSASQEHQEPLAHVASVSRIAFS